MKKEIQFTLNGSAVKVTVKPGQRLVDILRQDMNLTGTKEGCGEGECGACTIIVDGLAINSCLYPAYEIEGKSVVTIEGLLERGNQLSDIQQAFVEKGGIQCGFCTPGMIMSAKALLDSNPDPKDQDIRDALVGNLCRCTGYVQIIDSIKHAASRMKEKP
jgi:carbon-monoxide dehydrogenase small subunit